MKTITITVCLSECEIDQLDILTRAFQRALQSDKSAIARRLLHTDESTATTCFWYGLSALREAVEERVINVAA